MSLKKSEKENKHKKFLSNKYKRIMKERQKKNKKRSCNSNYPSRSKFFRSCI